MIVISTQALTYDCRHRLIIANTENDWFFSWRLIGQPNGSSKEIWG